MRNTNQNLLTRIRLWGFEFIFSNAPKCCRSHLSVRHILFPQECLPHMDVFVFVCAPWSLDRWCIFEWLLLAGSSVLVESFWNSAAIGFSVTSKTDVLLEFIQSSKKSPDGSTLHPFHNDGGRCVPFNIKSVSDLKKINFYDLAQVYCLLFGFFKLRSNV